MPSSPQLPIERFRNRQDAGTRLATAIGTALAQRLLPPRPIVLYALPRGGILVAEPIAKKLRCPLVVMVAKKISLAENPELAVGALTADGAVLWSEEAPENPWEQPLWNQAYLQAQEKAQLQASRFAPYCPHLSATGAIALVIDDGIATGMTMAAAIQSLRTQSPAEIWVCVPVAPRVLMPQLQQWVDRVITLWTPQPFWSVGRFYVDFPQITTAAAIACLQGLNQPYLPEGAYPPPRT
ncbi:hypothetical protein DO97_05630 [Neosynechococcus sphagnicola sy1]|uniref:Phosphoribosyltransferase domain-containing protein n=1 Tax=Neosynechococcus sphagnicola sy1 TaxID=1497020 RepID=A0A098TPP5_9CYAN|nr:phosphoribosyltransferase family protein [Neosynechococcus sphagnicola]KGF73857.1 hypothetical protein DO97_05630 [Neosynechococcus sphagnicola sy1]